MRAEQRFAANLRRLRREAGLSQEGLAARTGLHPTEISRLERAVREPRLGTIVRLSGSVVGSQTTARRLEVVEVLS